jgi:hypothetical protein
VGKVGKGVRCEKEWKTGKKEKEKKESNDENFEHLMYNPSIRTLDRAIGQ